MFSPVKLAVKSGSLGLWEFFCNFGEGPRAFQNGEISAVKQFQREKPFGSARI